MWFPWLSWMRTATEQMHQVLRRDVSARSDRQNAEAAAPLFLSDNLRESNTSSVEMTFEVWQFQRNYCSQFMAGSFIAVIGLLAIFITNEFPASLMGSVVTSVVWLVARSAACFATNQEFAHQVVEYAALALISTRLIMGAFVLPEDSFQPLEVSLKAYSWDLVRPPFISMLLATIPMRPSFIVILNLLFAARLSLTTDTLLRANNLDGGENRISVGCDVQINSMLPIYVFVISLFAYAMTTRESRSLFEHIVRLEKSHSQEVLATQRATRSEQRAHTAEKRAYEQSLQQRNRYLGAMCHDFGTPVAVLQMLLSMMRKRVRKDRERERRESATSAPAAGAGQSERRLGRAADDVSRRGATVRPLESYEDNERMLDLIRRASAGLELLEVTRQKAIAYSKLQAGGRLVPGRKAFEVAELLRKSASVAQDTGKNDNVRVETELSGDLPLVVKSDANWLFMILVNFASNSMKHTSRGGVTISASLVDTSRLLLEVSDTGSGVPAEFVPSLFQPFTSASTTATSVESTGLGLYHSKQLASILGGRVGYRPNAAGGATFVVEVPITFVSAAKTQEVLAKNRLELEGLVETAGSPEHRARAQVQRRPAPSARGDRGVEIVSAFSSATTMMASAAATSTTPSSPAPTANAPAASARATEGVTQNVDALATVTAHDGGGGVDSATARDGGQSSQSPRPSPRALASPRQNENALTSGVLAPSVLLTSLLSRVPPPLLVDDSELSRVRMSVQLKELAGVAAMEAESGDKALQMLTAANRSLRPFIVLINVHMAGRSGVETCRAIRAWETSRGVARSERLRIVGLLTLTNDAAGRAACLDAGMDDALPKPFDAAALGCCLEKLMP